MLCILFLAACSCNSKEQYKEVTNPIAYITQADLDKRLLEEQRLDRLNLLEERLVFIEIKETNKEGKVLYSSGRGILMDSYGLVVTASHVLLPTKGYEVDSINVWGFRFEAQVEAYYALSHPEIDVGIIRLPKMVGGLLESIPISTKFKILAGGVFIPNFDKEKEKLNKFDIQIGKATGGVRVTFTNIDFPAQESLRLDLKIIPGQSGSPVFDRYGNLAGIVSSAGVEDKFGAIIGPDKTQEALVDLLNQEKGLFDKEAQILMDMLKLKDKKQ